MQYSLYALCAVPIEKDLDKALNAINF